VKAEFSFNSEELVKTITNEVVKAIKPLLSDKKQEETLFTVTTLSEYLCVSKQFLYERISMNEIPFFKIGKFPRFKKTEIDNWLESQKIPAINHLSKRMKVIK
tara:strand:- start:9576 stop:9884 length:309 start_codon:yes stop_codon:yes gene_type:complete